MDKNTFDQLIQGATAKNLQLYYEPLMDAMNRFGIDTPERQAMFVANIAHESGALSATVENMNYSAERLAVVWPGRFAVDPKAKKKEPNKLAIAIARQPERIANTVYSNRMGNGDYQSGDGWKYRGRPLMGTTGKEMYRRTGEGLGLDLVEHPELLELPKNAADAACWFWQYRGLNAYADKGDHAGCVKKINGGLIGWDDRQRRWEHIKKVLGLK